MASTSRFSVMCAAVAALMLMAACGSASAQSGAVDAGICQGYASYPPYRSTNPPYLCDFQLGQDIPYGGLIYIPNRRQETVSYSDILSSKDLKSVKSATSDDSCLPGSGLVTDCRKQFFARSNKVVVRQIQDADKGFFCGKCFRLKLTNVQLADGTFLNPGDNNPLYPESRRCVVLGIRNGGEC